VWLFCRKIQWASVLTKIQASLALLSRRMPQENLPHASRSRLREEEAEILEDSDAPAISSIQPRTCG